MRSLLALATLASAFAVAPAAHAAVFTPGDPNFVVSGDPFNGPVSAFIGNSGLPLGNFTDEFRFTIGANGLGSGSISTSAADFIGDVTDVDFISVLVNGVAIPIVGSGSLIESAGTTHVPIIAGVLNTITINGFARGQGSYGGNISFVPTQAAIPEPTTWAMMLLGFAAVGFAMRRRPKERVRVRYAF